MISLLPVWRKGEIVAYSQIDKDLFEYLSRFHWSWLPSHKGDTTAYAVTSNITPGKTTYLHRAIMGNPDARVDHINGDKLDNRRENLRLATRQQNGQNRLPNRNNTYKGVRRCGERFRAGIRIPHAVHLGVFDTAKEAACAYDSAARKYFGDFARLNFPLENCKK